MDIESYSVCWLYFRSGKAFIRGTDQAWLSRHLQPWQTQASQWSQMAPTIWRPKDKTKAGENHFARRKKGIFELAFGNMELLLLLYVKIIDVLGKNKFITDAI